MFLDLGALIAAYYRYTTCALQLILRYLKDSEVSCELFNKVEYDKLLHQKLREEIVILYNQHPPWISVTPFSTPKKHCTAAANAVNVLHR